MGVTDQRREAIRLLEGLESGRLSPAEAAVVAEALDPVLIYAIVTFLRRVHPASDPAASGVLERVVRWTSRSPAAVRKHREGGRDPVARWFESQYSYEDFRGRGSALLELIADKLES